MAALIYLIMLGCCVGGVFGFYARPFGDESTDRLGWAIAGAVVGGFLLGLAYLATLGGIAVMLGTTA